MLPIGTPAPDFALVDQHGQTVRLSDFAGKRVVLYFYPRDNTPGCSRQAAAFAALCEQIQKENAVILGVSRDSQASHARFAEKYALPFHILSDPALEVIQAYGVWQEKKSYGKTAMGVVRTTLLIDAQGRIQRVLEKVKPDTNPAEVLSLLKEDA